MAVAPAAATEAATTAISPGEKSFPGSKSEDLTVSVTEGFEGGANPQLVGHHVGSVHEQLIDIHGQAFREAVPAPFAATLVAEHFARYPIDPRSRRITCGTSSMRRQATSIVSAITSAASAVDEVRRSA